MCNCSGNNTGLCSRCSSGLMCQCPPDYSILPLPVDCGCCPPGYTWSGATPNWPNGVCTGPGGAQVSPIPCTNCVESIATDCVILPAIPCFGVSAGTTLTSFINYLCSSAFYMNIVNGIASNSTVQAALCSVMSACPPSGGPTPFIISITPGP